MLRSHSQRGIRIDRLVCLCVCLHACVDCYSCFRPLLVACILVSDQPPSSVLLTASIKSLLRCQPLFEVKVLFFADTVVFYHVLYSVALIIDKRYINRQREGVLQWISQYTVIRLRRLGLFSIFGAFCIVVISYEIWIWRHQIMG